VVDAEQLYESLVDLNDDINGLRPVLATAWQMSPDGKT
jgi:ABC-type transport system substrate-binding protein